MWLTISFVAAGDQIGFIISRRCPKTAKVEEKENENELVHFQSITENKHLQNGGKLR